MAGYSGRALVDKLGVKPGTRLALIGAPDGFDLGPLPAGVRVLRRCQAPLDTAVVFVTARADLERRWSALTAALAPAGALWVAWPKKTAVRAQGIVTDMTEHTVREVALPTGWVDTKVCAIDDTWSGLKCVLRVGSRR